ncbi:unnamed protein product, partial [Protopolystoma xenopodis]
MPSADCFAGLFFFHRNWLCPVCAQKGRVELQNKAEILSPPAGTSADLELSIQTRIVAISDIWTKSGLVLSTDEHCLTPVEGTHEPDRCLESARILTFNQIGSRDREGRLPVDPVSRCALQLVDAAHI